MPSGSLDTAGFLIKSDSLLPYGFLNSDGSLKWNGFLALHGNYATFLCILPSLASEYSWATGKPSNALHAV